MRCIKSKKANRSIISRIITSLILRFIQKKLGVFSGDYLKDGSTGNVLYVWKI